MTSPAIVFVANFVVGATVRLPRLPVLGESLVGDLFDLGPGGKGSNAAVAAARQASCVSVVARVGDDAFADMAFALYEREGIDARYVQRTRGEATAVGLVYLLASGENTIGVFRGAGWQLSADDVEAAASVIRGARVLCAQLEVPDGTVKHALSLSRERGVRTVLNPAPARVIGRDIMGLADVLTPNVGEARVLLGLRPDDRSIGLHEVGKALLNLGAGAVVITCGADGCLIFEPGTEPHVVPGLRVAAVDTVGAGDAFNGGLAVALAEGQPLASAARWANATAALSTTAIGAVGALPDRRAVDAQLLCR